MKSFIDEWVRRRSQSVCFGKDGSLEKKGSQWAMVGVYRIILNGVMFKDGFVMK